MWRKLLFVVILLGFAAGLGWFFLQYEESKAPSSSALVAIPSDAAIIVQTHDPRATWGKLAQDNTLWEALCRGESFASINHGISVLDSLLDTRDPLAQLVRFQPLYISAHKSGGSSYNWLFAISLPPAGNAEIVHSAVRDLAASPATSKQYDEATIYSFTNRETKQTFSYSIYRQIMVASYSTLLVEDAIRQINSGTSVANDPAFSKLLATAGGNADGNVYVKYETLPHVIGTYLSQDAAETVRGLKSFAGWSELDAHVKSNMLGLNGFTTASDSANFYLSLFTDQRPQDLDILRIVPENTAAMVQMGFSDFPSYAVAYRSWLRATNQLFEYEKRINAFNERYQCNLLTDMLGWVDHEVALVVTEPASTDLSENVFAVLRATDAEMAQSSLGALAAAIDQATEQPSDTLSYRHYTMRQLAAPGIFELLLGPLFEQLDQNHYTLVGDYVVFGNSPAALRSFVKKFETEKTLAQNASFRDFEGLLSDASNIFVYSNIARSPNVYKHLLADSWGSKIEKHLETLREFEAVALQISSDRDGLFYNNFVLRHNPVYEEETRSLWEVALDTVITSTPWIALNHNTSKGEVVVQDASNKLYLLSTTGKVLWSRQLEERVLGEVVQIDAYKNSKLQLLFNTRNQLWLIDRNGKDVGAFPISLPAPASAPLACMDYDNNKRYRILVPCANGQVYNYSASGASVDGWKYAGTGNPVAHKPVHFSAGGKDYVVFTDSQGKVLATDRRGGPRKTLTATLPAGRVPYLEPGQTIDESRLVTTDTLGNIVRLYFNSSVDTLKLSSFTRKHAFLLADLDADNSREFVFADGNRLSVYNAEKELVFSREFDAEISASPQLLQPNGHAPMLGITTAETSEIWLLNSLGMVRDGLPLQGATAFVVQALSDSRTLNLVVGSHDKNIYTYSLE